MIDTSIYDVISVIAVRKESAAKFISSTKNKPYFSLKFSRELEVRTRFIYLVMFSF